MDKASLYREILNDHAAHPRQSLAPHGAHSRLACRNSVCNDIAVLYVVTDGEDRVEEVTAQVEGCTISKASASIMAVAVSNRSKEEIATLTSLVLDVLQGRTAPTALEPYADVAALSLISSFKARYGCAAFTWQALQRFLTQPSHD
mgnify:CR=1 FL=1